MSSLAEPFILFQYLCSMAPFLNSIKRVKSILGYICLGKGKPGLVC
jgi:hypothetical protein